MSMMLNWTVRHSVAILFTTCIVMSPDMRLACSDEPHIYAAHFEKGIVVDVEFFGPGSWLGTPGTRLDDFKQLKSIWITTDKLDAKAVRYLASIRSLEKIVFGDSAEDPLHFEQGALNELATMNWLKELEVNSFPLLEKEWTFLSRLESLEVLILKGIDVLGMQHVEDIDSLEFVRLVGASANEIPSSIGHLSKIKTLQLLFRESTRPLDAKTINTLRENRFLESLSIEGVDSKGVEALCELSGLRSLSLAVTEDVVDLNSLTKLKDLTFLKIDSKQLSANVLTSLSSLSNLETLLIDCPEANTTKSSVFPKGSWPKLKRVRLPYHCNAEILSSLADLPNFAELVCRSIEKDGTEIESSLRARGVRIELTR